MFVEVDGARIWYETVELQVDHDTDADRSSTVVLLHGGPGSFDHSYLRPHFDQLSRVARVVYLDLRDHGRSDWGDPSEWSLEVAADDVRQLCDAIGIDAPIVLGHSLGGPIAVMYAARHSGHIGGLILQSTFARFDLDRIVDAFRLLAGDLVASWVENEYVGDRTLTDDEWSQCWSWFGPNVPGPSTLARIPRNEAFNAYWGARLASIDVIDCLGEIVCPTLVSVGALDPITPPTAAEEVIAGLRPGPARLDVLTASGHFPWLDEPAAYWSTIEHFVSTI